MVLLLSIVIPVYNTEKFIEKCLRSVCEQTLDIFEIVIVNDCSPDNAMQIVEDVLIEYPHRKKYAKIINLSKNVGAAAARKEAFAKITSKYVTCLDSDDYIEETALEEMLNRIIHSKSDIVICDYYVTFTDIEKVVTQSTSSETYLRDLFLDKLHASYCNKLYKKNILDQTVLLNNVNMCEDFLFSAQVGIITDKIAYLNKPLLHYVKYNNNSYTSNYTDKSCEDIIKVIEFLEVFLVKYNLLEKYREEFLYRKLFFKYFILTNTNLNQRKKYISLYNSNYVEIIQQMPLHMRIVLFFAKFNINELISVYIYLNNFRRNGIIFVKMASKKVLLHYRSLKEIYLNLKF